MKSVTLQDLFEASPDAIILVDPNGIITLVNKQLESMLGYSREELFGKPVEVIIPQRFRGEHLGFRNRYMKEPMVRPMGAGRNLLALRKNGSELPVDIMLSPVQRIGKEENAVIATLRDATERVRTEEKLGASEALFKALFNQAPDAIVAVDRTGKIVRVNHQTELMFGYISSEILGQPIEILIPERFRHRHVSLRTGYTESPTSRPMGAGIELYARRKDGAEVPVDIMLSPVQLSGDGLVISVVRDITERVTAAKALEERAEQLDRSNKELEMFAYVASHDLKEPLRAVASSCQVLERKLADKLDAETREFLGFAVDGARRMRILIDDLLAFSRVSRTQKLQPISLAEPVERALANLKTQVEETNAKIILPDPPPHVLADAGQLAQVFQNLIGNALKFKRQDERPMVEIGARFDSDSNTWTCWVKDNGIGIETRFFERIFTLFQRLHTREQYPGTGIGLAITKKIIDRHGGKIWVESTPDHGSTFFFTLTAAPL